MRDELWRLKAAAAERERAEAAKRGQVALPRHHEPRDPHAARRHSRHGRPVARRRARAGAGELCRGDPRLRRGAGEPDRPDPRLLQDRGRAGSNSSPSRSNLRPLVEGVGELLAPGAQSKGLEIAASIAADAPRFVRGDALRLRQALTQSRRQRGQVHRSRRRRRLRRARRGRQPCVQRRRHRPGRAARPARRASSRISSRAIRRAPDRGHRARPRHHQAARRADGRRRSRSPTIPAADRFSRSARRLPARRRRRAGRARARSRRGSAGAARWSSPTRRSRGRRSPRGSPRAAPRSRAPTGRRRACARWRQRPAPDIVIVDCALGQRGDASARRRRRARPGSPRAWSCSRRSSGAPSAPARSSGFDGWLVKPVRARSLFERLAEEFPRRSALAAGARASPRPTPARARALVAEDNDINFVIAQKALRRLGFEVERASDGARGGAAWPTRRRAAARRATISC